MYRSHLLIPSIDTYSEAGTFRIYMNSKIRYDGKFVSFQVELFIHFKFSLQQVAASFSRIWENTSTIERRSHCRGCISVPRCPKHSRVTQHDFKVPFVKPLDRLPSSTYFCTPLYPKLVRFIKSELVDGCAFLTSPFHGRAVCTNVCVTDVPLVACPQLCIDHFVVSLFQNISDSKPLQVRVKPLRHVETNLHV